jgi:imidazolonepropionase-like amidohydrolase
MEPSNKKRTIVQGGLVVPASGEIPLQDGVVAIEAQRIVAVGPGTDFSEAPDAAIVIDATGCTVLPGLVDGHVHVFTYPQVTGMTEAEGTAWATNYLRLALRGGVTTIRDLASPWDAIFGLKRAVAEGWIVGPRLRVAGQAITMTGGHGHNWGTVEADGPVDVLRAARQQLKKGADVIKLMASGGVATRGELPTSGQLEMEEMQPAIREAHKRGKMATAHAYATAAIKNAVLAGVDGIEHGAYLDEETAGLMAERGVVLSPTLSVYQRILQGGEVGMVPAYRVPKAQALIEAEARAFCLARESGVKIALGTDATSLHHPLGDAALELELWVQHGMSPLEAIESATRLAAEACQVDQEVGTLEAGKLADLVIVEGDALADIKAIHRVRRVLRDGVTVYDIEREESLGGTVGQPVVQNPWT